MTGESEGSRGYEYICSVTGEKAEAETYMKRIPLLFGIELTWRDPYTVVCSACGAEMSHPAKREHMVTVGAGQQTLTEGDWVQEYPGWTGKTRGASSR